MEDNLFDDILNLEDQYYQEGYDLGVTDGSRAGRLEGRIFGFEKGFEKFVEMGMLHGKAAIWAFRMGISISLNEISGQLSGGLRSNDSGDLSNQAKTVDSAEFPCLHPNQRLRKHITVLLSLTNPEEVPTANTEDAVADFDDRLKRAKAKAKVIEKIVGESEISPDIHLDEEVIKPRNGKFRVTRENGIDLNMEDFSNKVL